MTESYIVAKIKEQLKKQLPGAVIFKLQDYMTVGVPDLVVNFNGRATWVEVKLLKPRESMSAFKKHFDRAQLATCRLLADQVRCYYLVAYPRAKELDAVLIRPERLANLLNEESYANLGALSYHQGPLNETIEHLGYICRRVEL